VDSKASESASYNEKGGNGDSLQEVISDQESENTSQGSDDKSQDSDDSDPKGELSDSKSENKDEEIDSNNSSNSEGLHASDDDWEDVSDSEVEDNGPLHKKAFRAALRKAPAVIRKGIFGLMKVVTTLRTKGYKEMQRGTQIEMKLVPTSTSRTTAPARSMVSKTTWNDKSWTSKPVSKNFQSSRIHFPSL
jgi:hypothetical protein